MTPSPRLALSLSLLACLGAFGPAVHAAPTASEDPARARAPAPAENLEPPVQMTVPEGFENAPDQAAQLLQESRSQVHLGGLPARIDVRAWHSEQPPALLYMVTMTSGEAVELPDVAIRSELEQVRRMPERVALSPEDTRTLSWQTGVAGQAAEATLRWQHTDYQTETRTRALAFQNTAGRLYFARADCVYPADPAAAPSGGAQLCEAALASLRPTSHAGELRALNPEAMTAGAAPPRPPDSEPSRGQTPSLQLRDPGDQPMPAIAIEREAKKDYSRYLYVFGGIFLIVAFYFTARSRDSSTDDESESEGDTGSDNESRAEGEPSRDERSAAARPAERPRARKRRKRS